MSRRIRRTQAAATTPVPVGAVLMGVARATAYAALASGTIPSVEIGGRRLILTDPFYDMLGLAPDDPRIAVAYELCGYEPPARGKRQRPSAKAKAKTKTKTRTKGVIRRPRGAPGDRVTA